MRIPSQRFEAYLEIFFFVDEDGDDVLVIFEQCGGVNEGVNEGISHLLQLIIRRVSPRLGPFSELKTHLAAVKICKNLLGQKL